MTDLILPAINILMLVGILFKYVRAPLVAHVSERSDKIEKDLVETAKQKWSAEQQKKEITAKLSQMDLEVEKLSKDFEAQAKQISEQLINKASTLANQIRSDAEASAKAASADLKAELISEFGILLVAKIEAGVQKQLTQNDKQNFRKIFTKLVEASQ
ncbi:MAG: ATP synthase F0 subunit B [Xanthomonadaceae bacterium]|nr:ATP synthase F0 subunit B [Xanthomonadaceae bacterium]